MVRHPEACTLVRERNLCNLSFEFYYTLTLHSAVTGNRFQWDLGCEGEGSRMAVCGGNICFKETQGPRQCVWPCVSRLGWSCHPWTTHCLWHQEDVMLKQTMLHPDQKKKMYSSELHLCSQTLLMHSYSQTHKFMLCWAPYFLALGLRGNTGVHLSGLHDCNVGSVLRCTAAPPHTLHTAAP